MHVKRRGCCDIHTHFEVNCGLRLDWIFGQPFRLCILLANTIPFGKDDNLTDPWRERKYSLSMLHALCLKRWRRCKHSIYYGGEIIIESIFWPQLNLISVFLCTHATKNNIKWLVRQPMLNDFLRNVRILRTRFFIFGLVCMCVYGGGGFVFRIAQHSEMVFGSDVNVTNRHLLNVLPLARWQCQVPQTIECAPH